MTFPHRSHSFNRCPTSSNNFAEGLAEVEEQNQAWNNPTSPHTFVSSCIGPLGSMLWHKYSDPPRHTSRHAPLTPRNKTLTNRGWDSIVRLAFSVFQSKNNRVFPYLVFWWLVCARVQLRQTNAKTAGTKLRRLSLLYQRIWRLAN